MHNGLCPKETPWNGDPYLDKRDERFNAEGNAEMVRLGRLIATSYTDTTSFGVVRG